MLRRTRHLLDLWHSFGRGRIPSRDCFKPHHFPALLPNLLLADVAENMDDYAIALAGDSVEKSYGGGLTNSLFRDLDLGAFTGAVMRDYEVAARERVAVLSQHIYRVGETALFEVERLILPFQNPSDDRIGRLVAGLYFKRIPDRSAKGAMSSWVDLDHRLVRPSDI